MLAGGEFLLIRQGIGSRFIRVQGIRSGLFLLDKGILSILKGKERIPLFFEAFVYGRMNQYI